MGNPHAVAFIDEDVSDFPLHQVGPMVEHHPSFPRRTNFEIVNLGQGPAMQARVWERGSGETMACGTGACAIAVAARLHGYDYDRFDVALPGGILTIEWDGHSEVYLEGPAEDVFTGEWQSE
jgi:diaminopimelate epimerase